MKDKDSNAEWERRNLPPSNSQGLSNFIHRPVSNHQVPLVHRTDRMGKEHPLDTSSISSASSSTFLSSYQNNKSFDKSQLKKTESATGPNPKCCQNHWPIPKASGQLLGSSLVQKKNDQTSLVEVFLSLPQKATKCHYSAISSSLQMKPLPLSLTRKKTLPVKIYFRWKHFKNL